MTHWHEKRVAQIGLRLIGLGLLVTAALLTHGLYLEVHSHSPRHASTLELGLCALDWIVLLSGNLLLFVGPALWKQVAVPGRWTPRSE